MKLSKHFTLEELSNTSYKNLQYINLRGALEDENFNNLQLLATNILEPLRVEWGEPITINSGYRCFELNQAINGSRTSDHLTGSAADITCKDKSFNKHLFELAQKLMSQNTICFGQLIHETPGNSNWIHISLPVKSKGQVLTYSGDKYRTIKWITPSNNLS